MGFYVQEDDGTFASHPSLSSSPPSSPPSSPLLPPLSPSFISGGIFFAKPMREKKYVTMMDPFQIKYGKVVSGALVLPALVMDALWVACTLVGLGNMYNKTTATNKQLFQTHNTHNHCKHKVQKNSLHTKHTYTECS